MSDLINRQKAIDAIDSAAGHWNIAEPYHEGVRAGYENSARLILSLPSVPPQKVCVAEVKVEIDDIKDYIDKAIDAEQWIPCSERLPEKKRKTYWVCTDTEYQCECRWTNNRYGIGESDNWGWSYFDVPQYTEVIAWMPLPEPYKGEQE